MAPKGRVRGRTAMKILTKLERDALTKKIIVNLVKVQKAAQKAHDEAKDLSWQFSFFSSALSPAAKYAAKVLKKDVEASLT